MTYESVRDIYLSYSRESKARAEKQKAIREAENNGDLEQLNKLAEAAILHGKIPNRVSFKNEFDLLNNGLPEMPKPLSFEHRTELYLYLSFLVKYKANILNQDPSAWRNKELKALIVKKNSIENLLAVEPAGHTPEEKTNGYSDRNDDFIRWVEDDNPDFYKLRVVDIETILKKRSNIWISGFDEWNRQQVFFKGKKGGGTGVIVLTELDKIIKKWK